jgi:hypothetical protein
MGAHIDLHMHTRHSDGTSTVADVIDMVRRRNLRAFAITDHDTLAGYFEASEMLDGQGPRLLCGVELSVDMGEGGHRDIHILAYEVDPRHEGLRSALESFREQRNRRGRLMVEKLNDLGIDISYEQVQRLAGFAAVSRPHVAEAIVEMGHAATTNEAFQRWIGLGGPAYVPKRKFSPQEAIDLIHQAGGAAVLAHPMIDSAIDHLETLVAQGLDGIEVYHSAQKRSDTDRLLHLAEQYRLIVTGGSDFHSTDGRYGLIGSQKVPVRLLEQLDKRVNQIRGQQ